MASEERVIVMFPTWREARPFMERCADDVFVAKAGIGPAECAASTAKLIRDHKPGTIILAGIAGAYPGKRLEKCDNVLVRRENCATLGTVRGGFHPLPKSSRSATDNYYDCETRIPDIFPKVVSNSVDIAGTDYRNEELEDARIENMEGAAFFAVCNCLDTPALEIRSISNFVGDPPAEWVIPQAAEALADGITELLKELQIH